MSFPGGEDLRPSVQLARLLSGDVAWGAAAPAIQSWASFFIHEAAVEILAAPDKDARRAMLGRLPETIRPRVEAEALRVWQVRRGEG